MRKIKVIHIITRLDKGGAGENTLLTVKGLNRERYEVKVIAGSFQKGYKRTINGATTGTPKRTINGATTGTPKRTINGATTGSIRTLKGATTGTEIEVTLIPEMKRVINPFLDLKAFIKLFSIIKKEKPTIVHTHTSKAGFLGRWAAKLVGVPIIIHTPHGHIFYGYFPFLVTKFFILLEKLTALITDYIITLTERGRKEHLRYRIGPPSKFIPIYSGIEKEKFTPPPISGGSTPLEGVHPPDRRRGGRFNPEEKKRELGIPLEAKVIGTIGRLEPIKGHLYFLKAARLIVEKPQFQKTRFLLVGEGPLRKKLEKQTTLLGIRKNVLFLGWEKDIVEILNIFDIFVLPSLNEGMGRVLLEAMLMKKPVVASSVGGIPDIIQDERTGFLVPPKDFMAISEAIIKLLRNPELAKSLGRKGKEKAEGEEFTTAGMVKRIEKLYERAIDEKRVG